MASLTPGVLSKLLENGGKKVTAPHRKALLQVTEIVPRLSDEGWQSRGYFLKLSDSLHCAYVSVSDHDADLICAGNLQLGQFVYVTHLDSASPVPLVRGLNPLPKRRPCVGNPTDLVSTDSLHEDKKCRAFVDTRRFSLDSSRRVWDHSPPPKPNKTAFPSKLISKKDKSNFSSPNNIMFNEGPLDLFKGFYGSVGMDQVIEKKVSVKADSPVKSPTISISPLKSKNENLCPKLLTSTPPRKCAGTKSQCDGSVHSQLVKVPLTFKTWYDASASWEDLPTPLCNLGKHVVTRRNVAFSAAVRFLEETSATDTVIQCMWLVFVYSIDTHAHSQYSAIHFLPFLPLLLFAGSGVGCTYFLSNFL
ncbi:hypothetical protein RJT34_27221 [Clitoria ternatea]|uniref:Uncharacterized protein n=1 Tax=Clitoria ternatea TaxID=43366 RepID=A0AAN9FCD3_CLITE